MRGLRLPFLIVLVLVMCAAMIVPALHAAYLDDWKTARAFFYIAVMSGFVALCAGLALANRARTETPRRYLLTLMAAFLLLPILMALPIRVLVPSLSATSAYMEMVSAFTTSGATVFDRPDRVPASIHLWRGLVGWLGGYLSIVAALAIMSPLDIGGFELRSAVFGQGALTGRGVGRSGEAWERLKRAVLSVTPIYTGGTFLVFLGLAFAGQSTLDATIHAMSAVSTSGISATGQPVGATGGYLAEMVVACGLVVFATALIYDPARRREARPIWTDPELGLLLFIISVLPVLLFLRHWAGVLEVGGSSAAYNAFSALWGSFFTVLSFLSTSGFASIAWPEAQVWSGLQTPGLMLLGLAAIGGGVASTAGGVKLFRVYALYKHGLREMERLTLPSSVAGAGGATARRIRREGAFIAWVFLMLFVVSVAAGMLVLSLFGIDLVTALNLSVLALANASAGTGTVLESPLRYGDLSGGVQMALSFMMILGRLESLAFFALLNPVFWRG